MNQISNSQHLETILSVLEKITISQNELIKDNEQLKKKLETYENLTNVIVSNSNITFLNSSLNVMEYGQDYISLLEPYKNSIDPNEFILECISGTNLDANMCALARMFGIIYLPDNRKRDWNVQLIDKKQHKFTYATSDGENHTDFSGKKIFNIFIFNYEQALRIVVNDKIETTLQEVEEGRDPDSAYGMLLHNHNIRKYYANLIRIKNSSEQFVKKLIQMHFWGGT